MERTLALLEQNRNHLDAVSKALLAKNRLNSKDLEELYYCHPCGPESSRQQMEGGSHSDRKSSACPRRLQLKKVK